MKTTMRRYQKDQDYWRIRRFLRDILLLNNREEISWDVARFDYWRWHGILNMKHGALETDVFIWEKEDGDFAAVLNREGPGSVFLQVHPDFRTDKLETEMVAVAEQYLTVPSEGNRRTLRIWTGQEDALRREILARRGYTVSRQKKSEHQRRRFLNEPISPAPVTDGYTIRPMGDIDDHHARCRVSWHAFHPNEADKSFEHDWYVNIKRAPLYRRDLDLVVVNQEGEQAAFCTIWFDDFTRTGYFEPVGTAPQHQRRGLGKAVLTEGLIRLRSLGADLAYIGSFTEPAHALYDSLGFKEYRILEPWVKEM